MESVNLKFAVFCTNNKCTRYDSVFFPTSSFSEGPVSLSRLQMTDKLEQVLKVVFSILVSGLVISELYTWFVIRPTSIATHTVKIYVT